MTAAHKTLPFGTQLRVTNLRNQRSAVVTVNDRGPFIRGRIVDVSVGAAHALGMHASGVAPVHIEVVGRGGTQVADAGQDVSFSAAVAPVTAAVTVAAAPLATQAVAPTLAHDLAGNAANPFTTLFGPTAQAVEAAPAPVKARRHHRRASTGLS